MAKNMGYNLTSGAKEYSRYFGNFRGVDFSSDHTQVVDTRFSYLVNMYKDYRNGQGGGVETFPGYRKIPLNIDSQEELIDIGDIKLVHISRERLPVFIILGTDVNEDGERTLAIAYKNDDGEFFVSYGESTNPYTQQGDHIVCFEFGEAAYVLTNRGFLKVSDESDGISLSKLSYGEDVYTPTRYTNVPVGDSFSSSVADYETEQRNLLSNNEYISYVGDGASKVFYVLSKVVDVESPFEGYSADLEMDGGYVKSFKLNEENTANYYIPDNGEKVTVKMKIETPDSETQFTNNNSKILNCTIATVYDNRVFLSGNPGYPNIVWWCGIPDDGSGLPDPTYWGELNYVRDGVGSSPIMGMFPVADTLCVLKSDTTQDGTVYYHSPSIQEGNNITPITYPSVRGLSGQGLISKNGCVNFRDDPVFITAQGLDAIGQLSVRYERATEHRSSLIDTKLLQSKLENARLTVWNGYLILYTDDGKAFLADSRATYGNVDHNEYEWYYLEDLGAYEYQQDAVRYGSSIPEGLEKPSGVELELAEPQLWGKIAGENPSLEITTVTTASGYEYAYKTVVDDYNKAHYYYCEFTEYVFDDGHDTAREKTEGIFRPATAFLPDGEDLYMATAIGLFKFNFDLRNPDGSFYPYKDGILTYARNNRAYVSGCATKMDNCGIPHLVKTTSKKSLVIKTRSELPATMTVKVRTNKDEYRLVDRLSDSNIDFAILDFADLAFTSTPRSIFAVSEKEKKWVEKQYYVYNDEFNKNFCLVYIAYRYSVSGKYKNK